MAILDQLKQQFTTKLFDKVALVLIWAITFFNLLSSYRSSWSGENFGVFSLCFIPMLIVCLRKFEFHKFSVSLFVSCLFMLVSLNVFSDSYFIQPFWGFYIEAALIVGSFCFALAALKVQDNENRFKLVFEFLLSILFMFGIQRILDGLFSGMEEYDWDKVRVALWATCFYLVQELSLNTLLDDLYKKVQRPTFLTKFSFILICSAWAFSAYKLGGSYQKTYFYFVVLILGCWLPRLGKLALALLLLMVNLHTGWQVIHMNYEVTYSFLFLLGVAILIFLVSQEFKPLVHRLIAPIGIIVLMLGLSSRFHLYHLNLKSTKSLLVEVATRMEMYQKGKIQPIQKEISNESKKRFGAILFTLIKFHPVDSYQDIFGPDLKNIFQHSRPMYSDENYNKFKSRLDSVLSRLNINWHVRARLKNQGKMVTISSIDNNSQVTMLKNEDFVSRSLNFKLKLKDGRTLMTKAEPRLGQVSVLMDDQVIKTISFKDVVYQHVPEEFPERNLQLHLQPDQLERVLEIQGMRIRIKISRIFGRKEADKFNFSQLNGLVFLKTK